MALAPWIVPPDYLGAMRAGAGLGLAAAAQDISGEESADRLRLAYSQMAQQERQQQRQLEAAKEYRAAQQLLRQGQMDALARYRQQMEADRTQRANLAERQFQALAQDRNARLAETTAHNIETENLRRDLTKDPEEQRLRSEMRSAQAAADVAKRKALLYTQTKPEVSTVGGGLKLMSAGTPFFMPTRGMSVTNQVPALSAVKMKEKGDADAALASAMQVLEEKQRALDLYLGEAQTSAPTDSMPKKLVFKGGRIVEE